MFLKAMNRRTLRRNGNWARVKCVRVGAVQRQDCEILQSCTKGYRDTQKGVRLGAVRVELGVWSVVWILTWDRVGIESGLGTG